MSSLIRRLEIRAMKRLNFTREKFILVPDRINGGNRIQEVRRGGEITDPDDNPIGRHWPARIPRRAAAKPSLRAAKAPFVPHALRRSKKSQAWLAARAAARKAQV